MFTKYPNKSRFFIGLALFLTEAYFAITNPEALGSLILTVLLVSGVYLMGAAALDWWKARR